VKRSGRNEPTWVAIHMCMEAMLGISLYSYLYIKVAKMLCLLFFISYVFSSKKSANKRTEQVLPRNGEAGGWGDGGQEGERWLNNVYTFK
jgi:hypothetical protein